MSAYYEYVHRAGYGSADHMADEIIARAARQLGVATDGYVAACTGLASHPVPMPRASSPRAPTREMMERALRVALREVPSRCRDVRIDIVCRRQRMVQTSTTLEQVACDAYQDDYGRWRRDRYESVPVYETVVEERRGREWIPCGDARGQR